MLIQGKLGKQAKKHDKRTLMFANYADMAALLPVTPPARDWSSTIGTLGMMMNDSLGDCTIAAGGHIVQSWTGANGSPVILPDSTILQYYSLWDGYVQGDSSTDNGGVEIDVLNKWRQQTFAGHSLLAYAEVNPKNHAHVMAATNFYGGLYAGVALPLTAQGQTQWTVMVGADSSQSLAGSWGGHAVPIIGYSAFGVLVVTWGQLLWVSWDFWDIYFDEAYCLIPGVDWATATALAPSGLALAALQADMIAVTS